MAAKSDTPSEKTVKRRSKKSAASTPEDGVVAGCGPVSPSIDPDMRRQLVAAEAYFRAERRGFAAGGELEDWVAAEVAVDSRQ